MATRGRCLPPPRALCLAVGALLLVAALCGSSRAAWSTLVDNGDPANRVDIVFLGDGYTQADLTTGLYTAHVQTYLDYMFGAASFLADPFPRYQNFFNVHQIDVVSNEAGADHPSQGIYRDTALDATYDSFGIGRLLTINSNKAGTILTQNLAGTGITADIRLATVNDAEYGGSGGPWAVYAGANGAARDIALHELGHSFSAATGEYVTMTGPFPNSEPAAVNATKDASGQKWSRWLGFDDPRASYLDIGTFEGAAFYPTGVYRPSLNSKMRTLDRPFNAVVREKAILDIYNDADPLDDWLPNDSTIAAGPLWVDAVDPDVIWVDWYVDDQLVAANYGESFDLADFGFGGGTYAVRAHAYDEVVTHAFDGTLLDLVRWNLDSLQQDIAWTVDFAPPIPGDYNLDSTVDAADYLVWKSNFGLSGQLPADGNGDLVVDAADYTVWRDNFAAGSAAASVARASVPEPAPVGLAIAALIAGHLSIRTRRTASGAVLAKRNGV